MTFRLSPVTAASVNENVLWDMVIWSNKSLSFELYSRKVGTTNWEQVNGTKNTVEIKTNTFNPQVGVTLAGSLGLDWQKLKAFTETGDLPSRSPSWNPPKCVITGVAAYPCPSRR